MAGTTAMLLWVAAGCAWPGGHAQGQAASLPAPLPGCEIAGGAIVRGPRESRRVALVFTAHEFGEGGQTILDELARRGGRASFFLTGDFLANPRFQGLVHRIVKEGHYLGPHSDKHLLYCAWTTCKESLVSRAAFRSDLRANLEKIARVGADRPRYFLPPFEHFNQDIAGWSAELGLQLINYTPGTRSMADYTEDSSANFVSSRAIFASIVDRERAEAQGLNGFLLLLHLGAGPRRADKFHTTFGELLDVLARRGYQFVRVDDLLERKANPR
jgi:peptidoglycan/xylan/chitin deacetylase (PgdA/CDA1 family)